MIESASSGWRVSRQAVCGASRPAKMRRMSRGPAGRSVTSSSEPIASSDTMAELLKCGDRPQKFATRRITPSHSQAPRSRLGPRLAPAPGCRPPEWITPPTAGASRQGERAGQSVMTSSSVMTASLTPDLGHSVGRLSRFIVVRVQPRTPWRHAPASRSVSRLGGLHKNRFAPAAARVA